MTNKEKDLYPQINSWFKEYLIDKYPNFYIKTTFETSTKALDVVLNKFDIHFSHLTDLSIKIDIVGILTNKKTHKIKLVFIEVKDEDLTLKDLGQLWGYTMIADPLESFLITSTDFGILHKILNIHKRLDLLNYGKNKNMKIVKWNSDTNCIEYNTMIPNY